MIALSVLVTSIAIPGPATAEPAPTSPMAGNTDPTYAVRMKAKNDHKRIEITSYRSETSTTFANPDGKTLHTEIHTSPIRVRENGAWQALDTTLVKEHGAVRPKTVKGELTLSAGGDSTLIKIRNERGKAAVRAPAKLPRPTLYGNTATYRSAYGSGIDLVVTVTPTGFRQEIVIRERPRSALRLRVPVEPPKGLTYGKDRAGNPALLSKDGGKQKVVAPITKALMFDAVAMDKLDAGRTGGAATSVEQKGDDSTLVVTPDAGFLSDPAVTYPVTVSMASDDWTGTGIAGDTFVNNAAYPDGAANNSLNRLLVGKSNSGTVTWRGYIRFNIPPPLLGGTVINSDLRMWNYRSNLCQSQINSGIVARRITSNWEMSSLTWSNQPSVTTSGQVGNKGAYSDDCSRGEGELWYSIEEMVQEWMDGQPDYGVRLSSVSESDSTNWRWYRSSEYGGYEYEDQPRGPVLIINFEPGETETVFYRDTIPDRTEPPSYEEAQAMRVETYQGAPDLPAITVDELKALREQWNHPVEVHEEQLAPLPGEDWETPDPGPSPTTSPDSSPSPSPSPSGPPPTETIELPLLRDTSVTNWDYDDDERLVAGSYDWESFGEADLSHSYLQFDTQQVLGRSVTHAVLKLWDDATSSYCTTDAIALRVEQVTGAWDPETLTWDTEPSVDPNDATTADQPRECDDPGYLEWPVSAIVQHWADGGANHGLRLSASPEGGPGHYERYFHSSRYTGADAHPPVLEVTVSSGGAPAAARADRTRVAAGATAAAPGFPYERVGIDRCANFQYAISGDQATRNAFNWCFLHIQGAATYASIGGIKVPTGWVSFNVSTLVNTHVGGQNDPRASDDLSKSSRDIDLFMRIWEVSQVGWSGPEVTVEVSVETDGSPGSGQCMPQSQSGTGKRTIDTWDRNGDISFTYRSLIVGSAGPDLVGTCILRPRIEIDNTLDDETVDVFAKGWEPKIGCDSSPSITNYKGGCVVAYANNILVYETTSATHAQVAQHIKAAFTTPNSTTPMLGRDKIFPGNADAPRGSKQREPLHRAQTAQISADNRAIMRTECPNAIQANWNEDSGDCDEYPFASTFEGAASPDWDYSIRRVNASQNRSAGGLANAFYARYRILETDPFWLRIK